MAKLKNATIRDVAQAAAVSPATVSMVLNNSERKFSDKVRGQVLNAVKELKYRPSGVGRPSIGNPQRKLESDRPKVVMLVEAPYTSLGDSIYCQVQKGTEFEMNRRKIDVLIQNTSSFMLPVETAGVIVMGHEIVEKTQLLNKFPFVVCMGRLDHASSFDHMTYDNRETAVLAARYLASKHELIGSVNLGTGAAGVFYERNKVFESTVLACGKALHKMPPMNHADIFDDPRNLEKLLYEYLAGGQRPTALFIPADTITSIAYPLLYAMGIIPGRDIEIVSCNNEYLRLAGLTPRPSVIDIRAFEIGRFAAMQLITRIEHPHSPAIKLRLSPELIEGKNWDKYIKTVIH